MGASEHDDAAAMLALVDIGPTPLRLAVAAVLAEADHPLVAAEILERVRRRHRANKVTLYRILDLFVQKGLAGRHSLGERAFSYCLGSRFFRHPHCHLRCVRCGRTLCLPAREGLVDLSVLGDGVDMEVVGVEVRIDGVCPDCAAERSPAGKASVDADRGKT